MSSSSKDFYTLIKEAEAAIEALCDHTDNLDGLRAAEALVQQQRRDMLKD